MATEHPLLSRRFTTRTLSEILRFQGMNISNEFPPKIHGKSPKLPKHRQVFFHLFPPPFGFEVLMQGGRLGCASGLGRMLEDLPRLRPTTLAAPPGFWSGLQKDFEHQLAPGDDRWMGDDGG